jgi:hypothetical protein
MKIDIIFNDKQNNNIQRKTDYQIKSKKKYFFSQSLIVLFIISICGQHLDGLSDRLDTDLLY